MTATIERIRDDWHREDEAELRRALELGASAGLARRLAYTLSQVPLFFVSPGPRLPFITLRMVGCMEIARAPVKLREFLASADGRALLRDRPMLDKRGLDELLELPAHTLGGAYARFATARNLDPQFLAQPDGLDPELAYVHRRTCETHDLWHVLLGFDTNLMAEATVSLFITAQFGGVFLHVLAVLSSLAVLLRKPWLMLEVFRSYRRGRKAAPLSAIYWERRWHQPLDEVRRELGIVAQTHPDLAIPELARQLAVTRS